MQRKSIVLWQSHFQGHIIAVLDTVRAILVSPEQTGIGPAEINLHSAGVKCSFVCRCIMLRARFTRSWLPSAIYGFEWQLGQSAS